VFLDDDDWFPPFAEPLLRYWLLSAMRRHAPDRVVVVGGLLAVTPRRLPDWRVPPSSAAGEIWGLDDRLVAGGKSFATKQAGLFSKAILEEIGGFDEKLRTRTSSEMFYRLTAVAPVVGHSWPVYCLNRGPHPKLTTNHAQREISVAYILEKHADLLAEPARRETFERNHAENASRTRAKG
jgi:hypothetical protein